MLISNREINGLAFEMLTLIALLPGLLASVYIACMMKSRPKYAGSFSPLPVVLCNIYLPALIFFPKIFHAELPGLPDLEFGQAAILPIFLMALIIPYNPSLQIKKNFYFLDFLVVGFVACSVLSEYLAGTPEEHTSLMRSPWVSVLWKNIFNIFMPYFIGKRFIHTHSFSEKMAKKLVILTVIVILLCSIEWRFVVNPFVELLENFFPSQLSKIPKASFRAGMVRLRGPFVYPILFGTMISIPLLLNYWLTKNRLWKSGFSFIPLPSKAKGYLLSLMLFGGLILTLSRGPLVGCILGGLFIGIPFSRLSVKISLTLRLLLFALIGFIFYQYYIYYSEMSIGLAGTKQINTMAYRAKLFNLYLPYLYTNLWWGWGTLKIPTVSGYTSIDNNYLWIAMKHGLFTLSFYVAIYVYLGTRLLMVGRRIPKRNIKDLSFAFTLFAIFLMQGMTSLTVVMTGQVEPLFFLLTGWAGGFLQASLKEYEEAKLSLRPQFA